MGRGRSGPCPRTLTSRDAWPGGFSAPQVPTGCYSVCLGFKGRVRPLWGSSLGGTSLLTSTTGGAFLRLRAVVQTPVRPLPGNHKQPHACPSSCTFTCMVHAMFITCTQAKNSHACVFLHVGVSCVHIHLHHEDVASRSGLCTQSLPPHVCAHTQPGSACRGELAAPFPLPLSFRSFLSIYYTPSHVQHARGRGEEGGHSSCPGWGDVERKNSQVTTWL